MATVNLTNVLANGENADGGEVQKNFTDILDEFNGNIDGENMASGLVLTGDFTVDTNTFFVDSANNRVGIGTITPTTTLHIDSGGANTAIAINDTASGIACIDRNSGTLRIFSNAAGSGTDFPITFHTLADGDGEKARLQANGHWSFATTSDLAQVGIQIVGTATEGLEIVESVGQTGDIMILKDGSAATLFRILTGGIFRFDQTMANSSKDPSAVAADDWVEIRIAGTTYFLPAYLA